MTFETFSRFWERWATQWHNETTIGDSGKKVKVSELCSIQQL